MKKIFITFAIALYASTFSGRAHAQQVVAYCSAYNEVGNWSLYAGQLTTQISCSYARSYLVVRGGEPIAMQSGYYNNLAYNRVQLRCAGNYVRYFAGMGNAPIQAAFNNAQLSGLPNCLFRIY